LELTLNIIPTPVLSVVDTFDSCRGYTSDPALVCSIVNFSDGLVVPIPTLPDDVLITSPELSVTTTLAVPEPSLNVEPL